MDITAEPVELCYADRSLVLLGCLQCRLQLRTTVERVTALAGFSFGILGNNGHAFGCGARGNSYALALEAEARLFLLLGTDSIIGDYVGHFGLPVWTG